MWPHWSDPEFAQSIGQVAVTGAQLSGLVSFRSSRVAAGFSLIDSESQAVTGHFGLQISNQQARSDLNRQRNEPCPH